MTTVPDDERGEATDTNALVSSEHRFEVTPWLYGDGGWRLALFVGGIGVTGGHFPAGDEGYREAAEKGRIWVAARDAIPSTPTSFGEPYGVACDTRFLANHPDDYVMVGPFPRRDPYDPETRKRRCCFELDAGDGMRLRVRQPDRAPVEARVIEMPTRNTYRVSIVGFEEGEHFEGQTYDVRIGEEFVVGASQMWAMWGAPAEA